MKLYDLILSKIKSNFMIMEEILFDLGRVSGKKFSDEFKTKLKENFMEEITRDIDSAIIGEYRFHIRKH